MSQCTAVRNTFCGRSASISKALLHVMQGGALHHSAALLSERLLIARLSALCTDVYQAHFPCLCARNKIVRRGACRFLPLAY